MLQKTHSRQFTHRTSTFSSCHAKANVWKLPIFGVRLKFRTLNPHLIANIVLNTRVI